MNLIELKEKLNVLLEQYVNYEKTKKYSNLTGPTQNITSAIRQSIAQIDRLIPPLEIIDTVPDGLEEIYAEVANYNFLQDKDIHNEKYCALVSVEHILEIAMPALDAIKAIQFREESLKNVTADS
jgi:hypothetical protein